MMNYLTHHEIRKAAHECAVAIQGHFNGPHILAAYAVPRGGVPAAYAVENQLDSKGNNFSCTIQLVEDPEFADLFIDDLIDSGATRAEYQERFPGVPFFTLFDKQGNPDLGWLVFPWEGSEEGSAEDICTRLLQYIGEDPTREGLQETPKRWLKAMKHWMGGYGMKPEDVMKVFEDGAEGCDEMVLVRDIPFFSHCEHHIAPIIGVAHVAYIPNGKIIGLSKLARLVDLFARRLQVQERLTNQVAEALQKHLEPLGCGVVVEARHLCIESRGVEKATSVTVTSSLHGVFKEDGKAREEFLMLTRGDRNRVL